MLFTTECPACGARLRLLVKWQGTELPCPKCNERFTASETETEGTSSSLALVDIGTWVLSYVTQAIGVIGALVLLIGGPSFRVVVTMKGSILNPSFAPPLSVRAFCGGLLAFALFRLGLYARRGESEEVGWLTLLGLLFYDLTALVLLVVTKAQEAFLISLLLVIPLAMVIRAELICDGFTVVARGRHGRVGYTPPWMIQIVGILLILGAASLPLWAPGLK